jgi:hypothetical protein
MTASWRPALRFLVLAGGLSAYAYLFERDAPPWEKTGVFSSYAADDIIEIGIVPGPAAAAGDAATAEPPMLLRYQPPPGGGLSEWRLVEPFPYPAHSPRIDGIILSILELDRIAPAPPATAPESVLGKDGPQSSLRFRTRGPLAREHTIDVGLDHPEDAVGLFYLRVDGGEVFLSSSRFKRSFNAHLDDLRSRALFPVPKEDAMSLEVQRPEHPALRLERRAGTQDWRLTSPIGGKADRALLHELLDGLNASRIERFVSDRLEDPAAYGFSRPRLAAILTHRRGTRYHYEFADDPKGELRGEVYARDPAQPFLYAVKAELLAPLERPAEELRSRYLLDFGAANVVEAAIDVDAGGGVGRFHLKERRQTGAADAPAAWDVIATDTGASRAADAVAARRFIDRLRRIEVRRYFDAPLDEALRPYLEKTSGALSLTIHLDAGAPLRLVFHRAEGIDVPKGAYLVAHGAIGREQERELALVDAGIPEELAAGWSLFWNRRLSPYAVDDFLSLRLRSETLGGEWTLGRIEETWHLDAGSAALDPERTLKQDLVERAARGLTAESFRVEGFLDGPRDLESLELTAERCRMRIQLELRPDAQAKAGKGFRQLLIGAWRQSSPGQEYYGLLDNAPAPVLLSRDFVDDWIGLVRHLDGLRAR